MNMVFRTVGVFLATMVLIIALGSAAKAQSNEKININTASVEMLQTLDGIGPVLAERIVEYRNKSPFITIEEITNVSGIGPSIFEKVKDFITVE